MIINLAGNGSSGSAITNETDPVWNAAKSNVMTVYTEDVLDANEYKKNGWGRVISTTANIPNDSTISAGVICFVSKHDNNESGVQLFYPTTGTNKGRLYTRVLAANAWGNWTSNAFTSDITSIQNTLDEIDAIDASNYYSKTEIDGMIPDTSDFVTESQVNSMMPTIPDTSNFVTSDDLSYYATQNDLTNFPFASDVYTKSEVDGMIPDTSDFLTYDNLSVYVTFDDIDMNSWGFALADNIYSKSEIDTMIPDTSDFLTYDNLSGYVTFDDIDMNSWGFAWADNIYSKSEIDTMIGNLETQLASI